MQRDLINSQIKAASYTIYESLLYIYNLVLVTGIFPDDLKQSRVTPIFKDGDKRECGNCRPISVISTIAKILEMLISNQLAFYLNEHHCRTAIWLSKMPFHRNCSFAYDRSVSTEYERRHIKWYFVP